MFHTSKKIAVTVLISSCFATAGIQAGPLNIDDECGHNINTNTISYGYNLVVDAGGAVMKPQGRPFQEGYKLATSVVEVDDHNSREYAQIFAFVGQIRDALMCDVASVTQSDWDELSQILVLNDIKMTQSLTGTPKEKYYSNDGIYGLVSAGENFHPMMKYLEEAELELKCLAFKDFDFTNPDGVNHCEVHHLVEGSGLALPK